MSTTPGTLNGRCVVRLQWRDLQVSRRSSIAGEKRLYEGVEIS